MTRPYPPPGGHPARPARPPGPYPAYPPPPGPYGGRGPPDPGTPPGFPPLADPLHRLAARLLDGLILSVVTTPLIMVLTFVMIFRAVDLDSETIIQPGDFIRVVLIASLGSAAVTLVVLFLYDWIAHARWGQTLGKRIVKIKVVPLDAPTSPRPRRAVARAAVYTLPGLILIIGSIFTWINVLWLLWDKPYRQCLHDKAAKTVVIKTGP